MEKTKHPDYNIKELPSVRFGKLWNSLEDAEKSGKKSENWKEILDELLEIFEKHPENKGGVYQTLDWVMPLFIRYNYFPKTAAFHDLAYEWIKRTYEVAIKFRHMPSQEHDKEMALERFKLFVHKGVLDEDKDINLLDLITS